MPVGNPAGYIRSGRALNPIRSGLGMIGRMGRVANPPQGGQASFMSNVKDRGVRYAVGSMGGRAGLVPNRRFGANSNQLYDKAILARGSKRISQAMAAGAVGMAYARRTKSGLDTGRKSIYQH